jgi:hypothetical protein
VISEQRSLTKELFSSVRSAAARVSKFRQRGAVENWDNWELHSSLMLGENSGQLSLFSCSGAASSIALPNAV